jgi:hypothetical protein
MSDTCWQYLHLRWQEPIFEDHGAAIFAGKWVNEGFENLGFEAGIQMAGAEGWELVAALPTKFGRIVKQPTLIFKKPK